MKMKNNTFTDFFSEFLKERIFMKKALKNYFK